MCHKPRNTCSCKASWERCPTKPWRWGKSMAQTTLWLWTSHFQVWERIRLGFSKALSLWKLLTEWPGNWTTVLPFFPLWLHLALRRNKTAPFITTRRDVPHLLHLPFHLPPVLPHLTSEQPQLWQTGWLREDTYPTKFWRLEAFEPSSGTFSVGRGPIPCSCCTSHTLEGQGTFWTPLETLMRAPTSPSKGLHLGC